MGFPGAEPLGRHTIGLSGKEAAECKELGGGSISAGARIAAAAGLATLSGNLRPVWAVQSAVKQLETAAAELKALASPTLSSGAAWGHSMQDLEKARRHGASCMAMPLGLLALGANDAQLLCLDAEAQTILLSDQEHGAIELPMDLPLLSEVSELLDGAIKEGRKITAEQPDSDDAVGAEMDLDDGQTLRVIARGFHGVAMGLADGPMVELSNPLELLRLAAEVRCLVIRAATAALQRREVLETSLSRQVAAGSPERVAP
jgi:hypothetical protein